MKTMKTNGKMNYKQNNIDLAQVPSYRAHKYQDLRSVSNAQIISIQGRSTPPKMILQGSTILNHWCILRDWWCIGAAGHYKWFICIINYQENKFRDIAWSSSQRISSIRALLQMQIAWAGGWSCIYRENKTLGESRALSFHGIQLPGVLHFYNGQQGCL